MEAMKLPSDRRNCGSSQRAPQRIKAFPSPSWRSIRMPLGCSATPAPTSARAGACSNRRTATPRWVSALAAAAPPIPPPTIATRKGLFSMAAAIDASLLGSLQFGLLYDAAPERPLLLQECRHLRGRVADRFGALGAEFLAHIFAPQNIDDVLVDLRDNRVECRRRSHQAEPGQRHISRQCRLRHGRHIG